MPLQIERDEHGNPLRAFYSWAEPEVTVTHELTCRQCGGDLLAGEFSTVCEHGCVIWHATPLGWLRKHFPGRRIGHDKQAEAM